MRTLVAGARIVFSVSGRTDGATLLLIHGGGAHRGWWTTLKPLLEDRWRIVTLDLSGQAGDSEWRPSYSVDTWAEEVRAVHAASGGGPTALVGHSMGGGVALAAAALYPAMVAGVVLLDSAVWDAAERPFRPPARKRVYPTREAALAAFKLVPLRCEPNRNAEELLAPMSIVERDGGWTWKWDPQALRGFEPNRVRELLPRITCPVVEVFGALSEHVGDASLQTLREATGQAVPMVEIAAAHHHVMLDQPQAVAAALTETVEPWLGSVRRPLGCRR